MPLSRQTPHVRVTLLYLLFAGLWILMSDLVVRWIFPDPEQYGIAQTIKGLAFILGTTLLIYLLLARERHRHEESAAELETAKARLERAEQVSAVMVSHVDLEGRWLRLPPLLPPLLGYSEEELRLLRVPEITHADDREADRHQALRLVRGEIDSYQIEKRWLRKDGIPLWVNVNGSMVRDEAGRPLYFLGYIQDISQRKGAEIARDQLTAILEATPDFVGTATLEGQALYVNRAGRRIVERPPDRVIERMRVPDFHPEWARRRVVEEGVPTALREGIWSGETALLAGDGREIPVSQVILAHRGPDGKLAYLSTVARDISERIRAEAALRDSQQRLEILGKATNDAVWDWNLIDHTVAWNEGITTLFGYAREDVGPKADWWIEHIHPDDRQRVDEDIHGLIDRGEQFWSCEYRYLRADGSAAYVFDRGYLMFDETGRPVRMIGAMMDLTERIQAEKELRESRAWLQLAVSAANIGLWDWNTRTNEVHFSREWKTQLGYREDEIENCFDAWEALVHPDDLQPTLDLIRAYLAQPWPEYSVEFRMRHKDGSYRWILARAELIPDETGQAFRMVGSHVDITAQKIEEERTRAIAHALSGAPGEGFFGYLVAEAARALGADCALVGVVEDPHRDRIRTLALHRDGAPAEPVDYGLAGTPGEGVIREEACLYPKHVSTRFPEDAMLRELGAEAYAGAPLFDAEGRTVGLFALLFREPLRHPRVVESALRIFAVRAASELQRRADEEARRELEARVRHAQKLESLGVLAGGIAHDFNNLLLTIMGNAGLAQLETAERPAVQTYLNDIELASQRAAELCRQLLAYSGKGKFIVESIDLNDVARDMANLLGISISKKAELKLKLAEGLPRMEGDPTQLRQVLMNLITNASDALGDSPGLIVVATGHRHCDRACLDEGLGEEGLPEGPYVWLEVTDTGCGMDEATLERIFDPFFTTKFAGRGLGMAAVQGIIRSHHGSIRIESTPGRGTRFVVLFPAVAAGPAPDRSVGVRSDSLWTGTGRALVADDEAPVREFARRALERSGFEIDLAVDGEEAVERVRQSPSGYRFVLLDLTMPRLSGAEACVAIRKINADLPILISSGYSEAEAARACDGTGGIGFIQKPYRPLELADAVRRLIGA